MPIWLWRRIVYPEPVLCMCYHLVSNAPVQHVKHYPYLATAEFEFDLRPKEPFWLSLHMNK